MPPPRELATSTEAAASVDTQRSDQAVSPSAAPQDLAAPPSSRDAVTNREPSRAFAVDPKARTAPSARTSQAAEKIDQGRDFFRRGQVLKARETFLVAVGEAPGEVLLELARTFDPYYLGRLSGSDAQSDPQRALSLYEEAAKHSVAISQADIDRLKRSFPALNSSRR